MTLRFATFAGRLAVAGILVVSLAGFRSLGGSFAPSSDPWPRWEAHDPQSTETVDHGAWTRFLGRYVAETPSGLNVVDYGGVGVEDERALKLYLEQLAEVDVAALNRDEQLAYWLNLYNALTIDVVLDHYPVDSIRDIDISPGLFSDGPWDKELITVDRTNLSLNDIEHRILRPIWRDPRIHYAVNCASVGCPNLQRTAFTAANADQLMDEAARAYINSPRGVLVGSEKTTISSIYDWFFEDFGTSEQDVVDHLKQYAQPALLAELEQRGIPQDTTYDWNLNSPANAGGS